MGLIHRVTVALRTVIGVANRGAPCHRVEVSVARVITRRRSSWRHSSSGLC